MVWRTACIVSGSPTRVSTRSSTVSSVTAVPAVSSRTLVTRRPSSAPTSAATGDASSITARTATAARIRS